jgi:Protein of unknown function (DUF3224)
VEVSYSYSGDLEGTGTLVYLIAYKAGAAPVLGLERFTGAIGGHEGSCVFRHVGSQDAGDHLDAGRDRPGVLADDPAQVRSRTT